MLAALPQQKTNRLLLVMYAVAAPERSFFISNSLKPLLCGGNSWPQRTPPLTASHNFYHPREEEHRVIVGGKLFSNRNPPENKVYFSSPLRCRVCGARKPAQRLTRIDCLALFGGRPARPVLKKSCSFPVLQARISMHGRRPYTLSLPLSIPIPQERWRPRSS